jgi:hypothetical protein
MILFSDLKKLISLERGEKNNEMTLKYFIFLHFLLTICFNFLDAVWASQFQF